jgi:hypothetical protein
MVGNFYPQKPQKDAEASEPWNQICQEGAEHKQAAKSSEHWNPHRQGYAGRVLG